MVFSQNPEKDAFSLKKSAEKEAPRENGAPKSGVVFRRTRSLRNRSFSRHRLYDNRELLPASTFSEKTSVLS